VLAAMVALMMEAASSSETSVNFYQTARHYNPEDSHLYTWANVIYCIVVAIFPCSCENLRQINCLSHIFHKHRETYMHAHVFSAEQNENKKTAHKNVVKFKYLGTTVTNTN
jgi:hypothetical protein